MDRNSSLGVKMKDIIDKVKTLLPEKRWNHVVRVADMAKKLARTHGINSQKAEIAAYLHDVSKFFTVEEMKNFVWNNDHVKDYEIGELLHGFAGAIYARNRFGIEDMDILNAIRFHTIGRKGMSDLEKLIYIADACEEGRVYPGVKEIREAAFISLDEAILLEANRKIEYLIQAEAVIHPNTIDMRNWLLEKSKKKRA